MIAHNLARWTARLGLGEGIVTPRTLRRRYFALAGRLTHSATALDPAPPQALALGRAAGSRARAATGDTAPGLTPAHSAGPAPRLAPARLALPRSRAPALPRSRALSAPERPLLAPAPPGERRHSHQTLRQPGSPPRHASIGGSGLSREEPWFVVKSHSITATGLSDRRAVPRSRRRGASWVAGRRRTGHGRAGSRRPAHRGCRTRTHPRSGHRGR